MYRHDGLDPAVIFSRIPEIIKIYRDQPCLPVMAVDQIRPESDHRKDTQHCLGEESKFFDIPFRISLIGRKSVEIMLVVNKIELYALILALQNSYIAVLSCQIHVKVIYIFQHVLPLLVHTVVLRQYNAHVISFLVKILWQGSCYICKSSCLNKWYTF